METVRQSALEARRAVHAAIESADHARLAELLRAHPGFADAADEQGCSALMRAVERGDRRCAELLLESGAAVNTHGPGGSALEVAAGRADPALVELLLEHGGQDRRVAFRIARERKSRPIMEMIAHREPALQLQLEFDSTIPDQKMIASESLSRRLETPVLTLPDGGGALHLSWTGARNTFLEVSPGKTDRTFTVEVQHKLSLSHGERALVGVIDGMWYSAITSGPVKGPSKDAEGRWRVRYAYYATTGSYEHYSALDVTIDLAKGTVETADAQESD
jgi:hypothetical protein